MTLFVSAFDMVHDPAVAVESLVSLGFERILTSGCDTSALEGLPVIKRLVEQVSEPGYSLTECPQYILHLILPESYELPFFIFNHR